MDKMDKLFAKKKKEGDQMDPMEKEAKMNVVKALRDEASKAMSGGLKGLKKPVAEAGKMDLADAQEALGGTPDAEAEEGEVSELAPEMEEAHVEPSTPEECDAEIERLREKKLQLQSQA